MALPIFRWSRGFFDAHHQTDLARGVLLAMPVIYRLIRQEDETAVLDLWAEALAEDREQLAQEWRARGRERLEHTYVAVAAEGEGPCAALTFRLQDMRDSDGRRSRVGRLEYLATRPAARAQGHGARLLEEAMVALRQAGCTWLLTSASPEVDGFYLRRGWRAFGVPVCEGELVSDLPRHVSYVVRSYDPTQEPGGWDSLSIAYAADSSRRPLTMVRTREYWHTHIAGRLLGQQASLRPPALVLVAARPADPTNICGYAIVHFWLMHENNIAGFFEVSELCTRPADDDAVLDLVIAVGEQAAAQDCQMQWGRLFVPREPRNEAAARCLFRTPEWSDFTTVLARPTASELDAAWLEVLFAAPGAICWSLDIF